MIAHFDTGECCESTLRIYKPYTCILYSVELQKFFEEWFESKEIKTIKTVDDDLFNIKYFEIVSYTPRTALVSEAKIGRLEKHLLDKVNFFKHNIERVEYIDEDDGNITYMDDDE